MEEIQALLLRGKKRALRLLERKDYSRKELADRLKTDGYSSELIEQILDYLDSFHYLDDVRVAETYICARKETKSRRELEFLLKQKGIEDDVIALALEQSYEMEDGSSPELTAICRQLQKLHITEEQIETLSYEEKQKLAAKLYRKGFAKDGIRKQLQL